MRLVANENENWKLFTRKSLQMLACPENHAVFFYRDTGRSVWYRTPTKRVVKVKFESVEKAARIFSVLTETLLFKKDYEHE